MCRPQRKPLTSRNPTVVEISFVSLFNPFFPLQTRIVSSLNKMPNSSINSSSKTCWGDSTIHYPLIPIHSFIYLYLKYVKQITRQLYLIVITHFMLNADQSQTRDCKADTTWKTYRDNNMTRTDKVGSQQWTAVSSSSSWDSSALCSEDM